jgi:hypothetical protein
MSQRLRSWRRFAVLGIGTVCAAWAWAQQGIAWPTLREQLAQHWKQTYPNEKVLAVEPKGKVEYYGSERRTDVDASWGWIWGVNIVETEGAFARQVALVTVERANKTQVRFEVAALYQRQGNAWSFRKFAVGKDEELSAAKAGDLPTREAAAKLFAEAWKKARPDFDVKSVEVLKSEAKQYKEKRWLLYKLAITAVGTDKGSRAMYNKTYRCTPEDYSSALNLENGTWVADEKAIKNVNEDRDCSLAK